MPKIKVGKLVTVVFLTVLIWIWADLALEETYPLSKVQIAIGKSPDPALWVNFVNPDGSLGTTSQVDTLVLKGPTSKLQKVKQWKEEGDLDLKLFLAPRQWDKPGEQTVALLDILSENPRIRQWGLTVESCSPETLTVRIDRLVEKPLQIRCVDSNDMTIEGAIVEPDMVDMYIPADWGIDRQIVSVQLTAKEIALAKAGPVKKRPYLLRAQGQRKEADREVLIRMPPDTDRLKTYTITNVTAGILINQNLQTKYGVKVENVQDLYSHIGIRATEQAKQAYEAMEYQVILEIDAESTGIQEKDLIYNFPQAYLRTNEIEPIRPAAKIRFSLVPLLSAPSGTPSPP